MKINWKVRFKNKVWLGSFFSLVVGFIYSLLALFDVFPAVTQSLVVDGVVGLNTWKALTNQNCEL